MHSFSFQNQKIFCWSGLYLSLNLDFNQVSLLKNSSLKFFQEKNSTQNQRKIQAKPTNNFRRVCCRQYFKMKINSFEIFFSFWK